MARVKAALVDLEVQLLASTPKAWRIAVDDPAKGVWIPRSQAELARSDGTLYLLTLPDWLAIEKGLV